MFGHLLVPIDRSPESEEALKLVSRVFTPQEGGTLTLLHVIPTTKGPGRERLLDEARRDLLGLRERIAQRGLHISVRLEEGPAAQRILDSALQTRPDLVVMATHGRTGVDRLLKGSVTEGVLRHCVSPLLVGNLHGLRMTGSSAPFHRILVPLDGSEASCQVLPLVGQFAQMFHADVILQRVEPKLPEEESQRWQELENYLEHFAERLREDGVAEVRTLISGGDAAKQILAATAEYRADLLAMSSHGREGMDRFREGSVAESVLRASPTPVLLRHVP